MGSKKEYDKEASFFKILLNDFVDYLPLPTAFANKYLEKSDIKNKQTVVLKTQIFSVKWSVKYYKLEDRYYFMDGWFNFIKHNRLQIGDFLVFWLRSLSPTLTFQVFFYAPNGCLKHPPESLSSDPTDKDDDGRRLKVREEIISNDKPLGKVQTSLRRIVRKPYLRRLPLTKGFGKAAGMDGYKCVRVRNDKGKMWEVKLRKYRVENVPFMTVGWRDFIKDNKMKLGDTFEISHVKNNLLHVHVLKKKFKRNFNKNPLTVKRSFKFNESSFEES